MCGGWCVCCVMHGGLCMVEREWCGVHSVMCVASCRLWVVMYGMWYI